MLYSCNDNEHGQRRGLQGLRETFQPRTLLAPHRVALCHGNCTLPRFVVGQCDCSNYFTLHSLWYGGCLPLSRWQSDGSDDFDLSFNPDELYRSFITTLNDGTDAYLDDGDDDDEEEEYVPKLTGRKPLSR